MKDRKLDSKTYMYYHQYNYVTKDDCLSEPEVMKLYCKSHPDAVCLGGYFFFGCCPEGKARKDFVKYDAKTGVTSTVNGKILNQSETYCGRKIPEREWKGKRYLENQIWARSGLGHPDLMDGNIVIEAKGGMPSLQKMKTAFGQLVFYKEHEPSFEVAFLFPRIWLEAESSQTAFGIFKKYQIGLIPLDK